MALAAAGADRELCAYTRDIINADAGDAYADFGKEDIIGFMYDKAVDKDRGECIDGAVVALLCLVAFFIHFRLAIELTTLTMILRVL